MATDDHVPPALLRGVIADDPLRALPIGAQVNFAAQPFTSDAPDGLAAIDNWDFFDGAVIALHFGDVLNQRILGSGILVAPGLALVARHVVEPEMDQVMAGGGFICTGISRGGLMIWRPRHVTMIRETDVAILTLEYASALPEVFLHAAITTRLPRVGERIFVAGLRHEAEATEADLRQLNMRMMVAAGKVTARYELGRDHAMISWPTLEVNCPAIGGMSGGPAFDENGLLVGLLSSSLAGEPNIGPAYLSLLWPALSARVTPPWPAGLYRAPASLLELDRRLCAIDRPEALEVVHDEATGRWQTTYLPWGD